VSVFDPATGKVVDRDALRSVALTGDGMRVPRARIRDDGAKVVTVPHDDDGRAAGEQIHHADGRVSARVFARSVRAQRRT
jgi:hypothetical protein